MGKPLEVSERIYGLRSKLGLTQAQLAGKVGVAQQSASDWESKTSDIMPSAESLARLGNLAPYPDALWFWEQAGIDQDAMLSAATSLLKERGQVPVGRMIAATNIRREAQTDDERDLLFRDTKHIPNLGSVRYLEVDGPASPPIHRRGTVILLDTSGSSATDLQPFWRKVVLVESTKEIEKVKFPVLGHRGSGIGLRMGRLCCASVGQGEYSRWHAILRDPDLPPSDVSFDRNNMESFGEWVTSETTDKWRLKSGDRFDMRLVRARAEEELHLYEACHILGHLLDWYRPPQEKGTRA